MRARLHSKHSAYFTINLFSPSRPPGDQGCAHWTEAIQSSQPWEPNRRLEVWQTRQFLALQASPNTIPQGCDLRGDETQGILSSL